MLPSASNLGHSRYVLGSTPYANALLLRLLRYCGIAVPLEIAFETDMVDSMCRNPEDIHGPIIIRIDCTSYLQWFWLNLLVDIFFIIDIYLNFRTGYMNEGHFVNDDWIVA